MFKSFTPPQRLLMGPGPTMVHNRVLEASARPTIGHLDPRFMDLMDEIKQLLRYVFCTQNVMTMPVSAPGSAGMEMCFVNLVSPGDKVVVCINGVFGNRMKENVERCGGTAIVVEDLWGQPVSPDKLEQTLVDNPGVSVVSFVHAETSTGALSDARELSRIAHAHGAMVIVDAVTSLAGCPLMVDEWELDAVYSGSQKCLSSFPGLSPVTFSDRALDRIRNREQKVQSWFLDVNLVMGYWDGKGGRSYHHTAPVNTLYALHEALLMVYEEGIENAWERHRRNHITLVNGLTNLGAKMLVEEQYRLPQLNSVLIPRELPEGRDDATTRRHLLDTYGLEIGAGLGDLAGKIWRIGLMGQASRNDYVLQCLDILAREVFIGNQEADR